MKKFLIIIPFVFLASSCSLDLNQNDNNRFEIINNISTELAILLDKKTGESWIQKEAGE